MSNVSCPDACLHCIASAMLDGRTLLLQASMWGTTLNCIQTAKLIIHSFPAPPNVWMLTTCASEMPAEEVRTLYSWRFPKHGYEIVAQQPDFIDLFPLVFQQI